MASWLEKLGLQRPRPPKEELKDFCLELCPDNRIASFMITDHTPRSGPPFIRFVKEAARKAVLEEARGVPDNQLLFYADRGAATLRRTDGEGTQAGMAFFHRKRRDH